MKNKGLTPVTPVVPAAPWQGGKRLLAKRICAILQTIPHKTYAEPFVGMGGVFLRREARPRAEVINDFSQDVITLFRILQRHHVEFREMLKWRLASRAEFQRLMQQDPATLTDLERAARFLYLQKTVFGGRVGSPSFGVAADRPSRFDTTKLFPVLEDLHERLASVIIECLPFAEFITRYDKPETLFYLDPPYWDCENDYGKGMFSKADFEVMATSLRAIKGRFVLSINDVPEIRDLFDGFAMETVETTYTVSKGRGKRVGELLISNHPKALHVKQIV